MELEGNTSRGGVTWEYMHACDSIVPLAIFLNAQFLEKTEPLLIRSYWLAEVRQFTGINRCIINVSYKQAAPPSSFSVTSPSSETHERRKLPPSNPRRLHQRNLPILS